MTKEQARIYFLNQLDEDLDEVWEQFFFEQKNYFLTHAPIPKIWFSRLDKMSKKHQAYLVLTDKESSSLPENDISFSAIDFPIDFVQAFNFFHRLRAEHKAKLIQAESLSAFISASKEWLLMEKQYVTYWSLSKSEDDEIKAIRSIEPDPMLILNEFQKLKEEKNIQTIHELKENFNNLSENVRKEVKRLTLLAKDF